MTFGAFISFQCLGCIYSAVFPNGADSTRNNMLYLRFQDKWTSEWKDANLSPIKYHEVEIQYTVIYIDDLMKLVT